MKFKYEKLPAFSTPAFPHQTHITRPLIPVKLIYEGQLIKTKAIIDSGADWCLFNAELGELIGLNVRAGDEQDLWGITGDKPGTIYFHDIMLEIGGVSHAMKCGFSYDLSKAGYNILGQLGFFDLFEVKFRRDKKQVELKEI